MITGSTLLIPRFLDSFQGFSVKDIKEFSKNDGRTKGRLETNCIPVYGWRSH